MADIPIDDLATESNPTSDSWPVVLNDPAGTPLAVLGMSLAEMDARYARVSQALADLNAANARTSIGVQPTDAPAFTGLTTLERLLIESAEPFVNLIDTDATEVTARNYEIASSANSFLVRRMSEDGLTVLKEVLRYSGVTDILEFDQAAEVLVPAISGDGQAAQVTNYDAATGRLTIGDIEMGDTGTRKVLSWTAGVQDVSNQIGTIDTAHYQLNGTGELRMRRIGNRVSLWSVQAAANTIETLGTTKQQLLTTNVWPSGFRLSPARTAGGSYNGADQLVIFDSASTTANLGIRTIGSAVALDRLSVEWITGDSWPSSLPGVAA